MNVELKKIHSTTLQLPHRTPKMNPNQENATPPRRAHRYRTPQKRPLGRIALFPSAYQCPWLGREHLVYATIQPDSKTLYTDEGDCFEGVGHWVQAEQRRELMRLQMESLMSSQSECPDTPALFRSQNNQLPTVGEGTPLSEEVDIAQMALDALDSLAIEIHADNGADDDDDDDDIYNDDEIEDEGVDLEEIDSNGEDMEGMDDFAKTNSNEPSLHASMGRRWKHIDLDDDDDEDEDDFISPRSITSMGGNGGERIMVFDEVDEEDDSSSSFSNSSSIGNNTSGSNVWGKGKKLLQKSLASSSTSSAIAMESLPMVGTGSVQITPMEFTYDDDEDQENDDAVAAALAVFKSILNNTTWQQNSPSKNAINRNNSSSILVGGQ